jgi:hypothetical protein
MPVSAITDQTPALQQQLPRARARVEPGPGAVTEAVALGLVPAWSLFWLCGALLTRDTLVSLAANVPAERPGLKIATEARLKLCAGSARRSPSTSVPTSVSRRPLGWPPKGSVYCRRWPRTHPSALVRLNEMYRRTTRRGQK